MRRKKLFLIDGNSYCYRAHYALLNLSTSDGRSSGAVFGFVNMLNKLKQEGKPDYLAVCFDLKGPTLRHEKFAAYKSNRKPMPDELVVQMPIIKELISAYGIPVFQLPGYEADDLIATLVKKFKDQADIFIVTSDKDMMQLVDDQVKIFNPQKKDESIVDADKVFATYGVKPSQITDLLALAGDSSDNIPGVPGIGFKTAAELISEFGSLDQIITKREEIRQEKRRKLITEFSDQAILCKELATVIADAPIEVSLEKLKPAAEDTEVLRKIFKDLEFRNLAAGLREPATCAEGVKKEIINDLAGLKKISADLKTQKEFFFEIEADPDQPGRILALEMSFDGMNITRLDLSGDLAFSEVKKELGLVLEDRSITKIGFDLKKISVLLNRNGVYFDGMFFDIMVAAYLLDPGAGKQKLPDLAYNYLDRGICNASLIPEYALLYQKLLPLLKEKGLWDLFEKVEMPLVRVLASMEISGIKVDENLLKSLEQQMDKRVKQLTQEIYEVSGCEFNINSPKQLSEVLFNKLKLPLLKKGKSGPSTDSEVLQQLAREHRLPALLLEYREITKLSSTFITGLLALIDEQDGRLHTSFNQVVTATGRLSSSEPNLQNIPVRTAMGRQIRGAFIAGEQDWQLLSADYSQIELRVLAHLSHDEQLIKAFSQGLDIHSFTASLVFSVPINEVTDQMRDQAKRVNFGIIYGMGPHALAKDLQISFKEAKEFIAAYFRRYPAIEKYLKTQVEEAKTKGYVMTLLHRRRYIPQINSPDAMMRGFSERVAMNTPIQGTAADLIKVAMVDIDKTLKQKNMKTRMLLQVHDELVFESPAQEIAAAQSIVRELMENVLKLKVPVKVGIKIGKNWKDMAEVDGN